MQISANRGIGWSAVGVVVGGAVTVVALALVDDAAVKLQGNLATVLVATLLTVVGLGLLTLVLSVKERLSRERYRLLRDERPLLERHADTLLALAKHDTDETEDLGKALRHITETAAETLGVDRVSVWLYTERPMCLRCIDLFETATGEHSSGEELLADDYPAYFEAVETDRAIAVHDVHADPRTTRFAEGYLDVHAVRSSLDCPIRNGGETVGVIRHESVGEERAWTRAEEQFACSLAAMVALATEHFDRRREAVWRAEAEERYRSVVENVSDALFTLSPEGEIVSANGAFEEMTGRLRVELEGMPFLSLVHKADRSAAGEVLYGLLRGKDFSLFDLRLDSRKSDERLVEFRMHSQRTGDHVTGLFGVGRDVTERKRLERELRQAQKMEAIGRLAGGIAHDFNNMLTVILGCSDLLRTSPEVGDANRGLIHEIRAAGQGAQALIHQLLAFSRRQVVKLEPLDIGAAVECMAPILRRLIGEDVCLTTELQPGLGLVMADLGQIEQVLLNLCVNARDAMPGGGSLQIETRDEFLNSRDVQGEDGLEPGRYVSLAVTDTGEGIPDDVKSKVFEPFFTTKGEGAGTGLGLATVYGIVKQSGGTIHLVTIPGEGTQFTVYLPRIDASIVARRKPPQEPKKLSQPRTVLVVEDNEQIREVVRYALVEAGFAAVAVGDAEAALQLVASTTEKIDALVTDVVMPGKNGWEFSEEFSAMRPEAAVIYMSGYAPDTVAPARELGPDVNFLPKPFRPAELIRKVHEAIAAASAVADTA